jgi:flagellar hook-associated protein 1 FlgK
MPNDLMDRRDLLVDQLASIIDISVNTVDPDEFMIHTSGQVLVQGDMARQFDLRRDAGMEGFSNVFWRDTGDQMRFARGSLGALMELRDDTIANEVRILDNMTMNFVDLVNEIHRDGYGINGATGVDFFSEFPFVPNAYGNFDRSGGGVFDSSYIYRINGRHSLEPRDMPGLEGTITLSGAGRDVQVPYFPTDTVADIIGRINNSGAEVVASLNRDGVLSLKATAAEPVNGERENPDFVIRHVADDGHFLRGYSGLLGQDGVFDWGTPDAVAIMLDENASFAVAPISHPSGWIEVNPDLLRDPLSVASGFGENGRPSNPGNGDAAQAIASIRNSPIMVGALATFDDYFADSAGRMGLLGEQSERALMVENRRLRDLENDRQSISGVNIDEELTNMIRFQQGYNAAARFVSTVNQMLDVLMRLGA